MDSTFIIKNLSHKYRSDKDQLQALTDLNLTLDRGEIFGFLGPNGAGKTTTIKLLLGILRVQDGELSLFGKSPEDPNARMKVGYMPEIATYYKYLTPKELLSAYGDIFRIEKRILLERIDLLLESVGLKGRETALMGTFSKGMMQKVSFAQALINDPDLLILDEPTSGLDPVARRRMRDVIQGLRSQGKTIFFSSHELSEVELICDRIGILHKGQLKAVGTVKDLLGEKGAADSLENYFLKIIGE